MILDSLICHLPYGQIHPLFDYAFEYLNNTDLALLPDGRQELIPGKLYAVSERTEGRGKAGARLEAHRSFIDIQYVVSGSELIGWRERSSCIQFAEPYDEGRDVEFFGDPPRFWMELPAGYFAIFAPEDAHAPLAGTGPVHKVVLKVALL